MPFDFSETPITLFLLITNAMVSFYALNSAPHLIGQLAFKPDRILRHGEWYRLATAGFVHVGIGHLAFNMITLFFFGPLLELRLGVLNFIILYFGSDLAAQGLSLWKQHGNPRYSAVGASGAISGVLFAFCLYRPFDMLYLFFAVPIPAIVFAVGYVVASIYAMQNRRPGQTGGLAHEAHLGGALGGLVLTMVLDPDSILIFLGQVGL